MRFGFCGDPSGTIVSGPEEKVSMDDLVDIYLNHKGQYHCVAYLLFTCLGLTKHVP